MNYSSDYELNSRVDVSRSTLTSNEKRDEFTAVAISMTRINKLAEVNIRAVLRGNGEERRARWKRNCEFCSDGVTRVYVEALHLISCPSYITARRGFVATTSIPIASDCPVCHVCTRMFYFIHNI